MCSIENIVNNIGVTWYVDRHGDNFVIHSIIESLCYTLETNIIL